MCLIKFSKVNENRIATNLSFVAAADGAASVEMAAFALEIAVVAVAQTFAAAAAAKLFAAVAVAFVEVAGVVFVADWADLESH